MGLCDSEGFAEVDGNATTADIILVITIRI
jgi:hypothetical protein